MAALDITIHTVTYNNLPGPTFYHFEVKCGNLTSVYLPTFKYHPVISICVLVFVTVAKYDL